MNRILAFVTAVTLIALIPINAIAISVQLPSLGIMLNTRKVVHVNDVDKVGLALFRKEYNAADKLPGDMVVLINSDGGYELMGQEMINAIKDQQNKAVRVICIVETRAMSMAFNLLTNCSVRVASKEATLLFHKLSLVAWPKKLRLTAKNLRVASDEVDKDDEPYRQANAKALKITLEQYDTFANNDIEWTAREMRMMGYLNAITQ